MPVLILCTRLLIDSAATTIVSARVGPVSITLWQTHQMSHSGVGKAINRLQLTWYWVGLHADVWWIVRSCEICQKAKSGGLRAVSGQIRMYAGRPWQKVAVDLVGPMPETRRAGNKWILVVMDHFL